MGIRDRLFGFCLVSILALSTVVFASENDWSRVKGPSHGPSRSIGFYSSGCIAGAQILPLDGRGYQVMRPSRNRYYGHGVLIRYIENLASTLEALGTRLLVSDLGQPRGGPMPFGHSSHQVGLDADIWFWDHPEQSVRSLTIQERDQLPMVSMLNENGVVDPKKWGRQQLLKLRLAAESSLVQRIFVNPAIKTYLCSQLDGSDRHWLHKLRPWPGHDSHFHVRLYCPADSKDCRPQEEQPTGDGCEELLPPKKSMWDDGATLESLENEHSTEHSESDSDLSFLFKFETTFPAACQSLLRERAI
jgi:penicillin-insensitive murein endopeptidase